MSKENELSRRSLLGLGIGATAGWVGSQLLSPLSDEACEVTPPQVEGPFYPIRDRADEDADLTRVKGRSDTAEGQIVYVEGRVTDEACEPVEGALVEIWQANKWGRYDHKEDPNPAPGDPNFQGWGHAVTDAEGRYRFKTVKPGPYPVADGRMRTPHIHFKVAKGGFHGLTTQMYFEGEELNAEDFLLKDLPLDRKDEVVIGAQDPPEEAGDDVEALYTFDLALRRVERPGTGTSQQNG